MRQAKVTCPDCGRSLGYQGFSLHMRHKHGKAGMIPPMNNAVSVVPGEHPVESIEGVIIRLIEREKDLSTKLDEMREIRHELEEVSALRASLEELVTRYKQRKEELTMQHA